MAEPADDLDPETFEFLPAFPGREQGRPLLPRAPHGPTCPFCGGGPDQHGRPGDSCPWKRVSVAEALAGWEWALPWLARVLAGR